MLRPRFHNDVLLDNSQDSMSALKRRDFLLLSGAAVASLLLPGCGGGSGAASSNTGVLPGRTELTGDLRNQIDQYSLSADRLSSIWQAQSDNVNAMVSFTAGRAARADTNWPVYFQATYIGLLGLQTIYELFARQFVEFDNIGYLGEQVTARNNLQGTNALTNPHWLMAMMERGQVSISTFGYILEVLQTNGLGELLQTVRELTDPTEQLVFYGVVTEIFNGFVTKVAARVQFPLDPTWLLDVGNDAPVTNARALAELNRVVGILNQLPFGPGFHTTVTLRDQILDPKDALPSVIGEILTNIQETLKDPKAVKDILITIETDLDNYTKRIDLDTTRLSKFVLRNIAKEIAKDVIKKAVVTGLTKWKGKLIGVIADCVIEIIDKSIDLAKYFSGTVLTLEVLPLAIAFATLTTLQLQSLIQKLIDCLMMIQKELPDRPPPIILRGIIIIDVPPPVRIPYVVNIKTAETDQIKRSTLLRGGLWSAEGAPVPRL